MRTRLIILMVLIGGVSANAQRDVLDNSKLSERLYFGGGLGLNGGVDSYGNKYFFVGFYPIIGYMVNNQFSVGTGITYQYYNYSDIGLDFHQYGVSPFARYNFGQMFAYTEYMLLSTKTYQSAISASLPDQRKIYDRLLFGLGYSQPLGGRASLNVIGMYDIIWSNTDRVFASPWVFRVYVGF